MTTKVSNDRNGLAMTTSTHEQSVGYPCTTEVYFTLHMQANAQMKHRHMATGSTAP